MSPLVTFRPHLGTKMEGPRTCKINWIGENQRFRYTLRRREQRGGKNFDANTVEIQQCESHVELGADMVANHFWIK